MNNSEQKLPIIGILANIEKIEKEPFAGTERAVLHYSYIDAIAAAGGVPLLLPIVEDEASIQRQISSVDGLLLSGGYDVQPLLYGEEPHPALGFVYPKRDHYEIKALQAAYALQKPILGICRGLQLINVAFGGTLYQDVSQYTAASPLQHSQNTHGHYPSHTATVMQNTKLHAIVEKKTLLVNSFHHQAVKEVAPTFCINATAPDGIIEGIEKTQYPFFIAVQWHPERMANHHLDMHKLFQALVYASDTSRKLSV